MVNIEKQKPESNASFPNDSRTSYDKLNYSFLNGIIKWAEQRKSLGLPVPPKEYIDFAKQLVNIISKKQIIPKKYYKIYRMQYKTVLESARRLGFFTNNRRNKIKIPDASLNEDLRTAAQENKKTKNEIKAKAADISNSKKKTKYTKNHPGEPSNKYTHTIKRPLRGLVLIKGKAKLAARTSDGKRARVHVRKTSTIDDPYANSKKNKQQPFKTQVDMNRFKKTNINQFDVG